VPSTKQPYVDEENKSLFIVDQSELVNALDFSADVFIEDNDCITAIELKSVKPNSGEMRGEKQKILEGKAALYRKYNKKIKFYIGFPFDSTVNIKKESATQHNKGRFLKSIINMNKYFDEKETLLSSELWDFLSNKSQTMEMILEIINKISTTDFLNKFQYLNDNSKRNERQYSTILDKWYMFSEKVLIENDKKIKEKIKYDISLTRLYNQTAFDNKGKYNYKRCEELIKLIQ